MPDYGRGGAASADNAASSAVTKAQKFEDEKRRIIASCFSKVDTDGSLLESYITHCRIIEDAAYPSSPPPQNSPIEQKKARVILVAVRKSGRVRMHKARENTNGTYSIGKTWNLDDLQQIENYPPPDDRGFTVTIIKPYFWQANSTKEKDFFIQSILKIFKKYTGGSLPVLIGFEGSEIGQLADGAGTSSNTTSRANSQREPRRDESPSTMGRSPIQPPSSNPTPSKSFLSNPALEAVNRPLRNQQSSPAMRSREDGAAAPSSSSLRSMQSATSLQSSMRTQETQNKTLSIDTQNSAMSPDKRRPSDTSSTRSGTSISTSRVDRAGSSGPTSRAPAEDQRSERSVRAPSSASDMQPPPVSLPIQQRASEQPAIPPPRKTEVTIPKSATSEVPPTPGRKKSTKDIASQFKLAAATYTASGFLSKNKGASTPLSGSFPAGSGPDAPKIKYPNGNEAAQRSLKDKISGPIIEPPPRSDARSSGNGAAESRDRLPLSNPSLAASTEARSHSPAPSHSSSAVGPGNDSSLDFSKDYGAGDRNTAASELSIGTKDEDIRLHRRSISAQFRERKQRVSQSVLDELDMSNLNVNVGEVLKEFNWDWRGKVENLEMDIKKELATVEAKNVLINPGGDERLEELGLLMDKAIEECERMDGLLTLYAVELTSLTDDIAHIENQSQGLQVQTANQKTLQKELETLLTTISISPAKLEALKQGSLESPQGLEKIETTLLALYKAMQTIDPTIGSHNNEASGFSSNMDEESVGSIRALQERKEVYRQDCKAFLGRLRQFMNIKFQAEMVDIQKTLREADAVGQAGRQSGGIQKPKLMGHDHAYASFYRFSGLLLFAKEVDKDEFLELQRLYERPVRAVYQEEFRDHIFAWKRISRKITPEEMELVFTAQEKEHERISSTVRTLTVKRSQTLAKSLRSPITDNFDRSSKSSRGDPQEGKLYPHESFTGALDEFYRQVFREQNFIMEFFHLSTQNAVDYAEFVASGSPEKRVMRDLGAMRTVDQDRMVGRMLFEYMGELFSFFMVEMGNFVEWAVKTDPIQGVGILYALEQKIAISEDTNQEFLMKTLKKMHDRLTGLFSKFLDEQVRAIEDTKLKLKKRKGVISFMKIFPPFCARIEDQLPPSTLDADAGDIPGSRQMVNQGYSKVNKAMFESLQAIAKESPHHHSSHHPSTASGAVVGAGVDPEDKEQLNYHIMMIENMNHYVEEVDTRGNLVLAEFMRKAEMEYKEHMGLYVGAVIRRPLGKLLDFIESLDAILKSTPQTIEEISSRLHSHSKPVLKKILSHYDAKEIRRGVETLRKRVDKHFSVDGDGMTQTEQAGARRLCNKISRELMEEYLGVLERVKGLVGVGSYVGLEVEWGREDVVGAFTK